VLGARLAQQPRRVDAKTRLGIGEAAARRQADPEIRETVGAVAQCRHVRAQMTARADDQRLGPLAMGGEQRRNILGPVLPVAVEREHRARAALQRALHAAPQARALAEIARIAQELERQAFERRGGSVARAVVDHDQRADLAQRALGNSADGGRLVEGRNHGHQVRAVRHGHGALRPSRR